MKKSISMNNKAVNNFLFGISITFLFIITACEIYNQDDYEELIVVEAYAIAGRPLPLISITVTSPVDEVYDPSEVVLTNANVQVVLLDESGNETEVFDYIFATAHDGFYLSTNLNHTILPNHTYRLDIDFDDRPEVIRATTTIPDNFKIINEVPDSFVYQSVNQLEITISETTKRNEQQSYVFSAIAKKPEVDNLTPFYKSSYDDDNISINDVLINSSGLINEGNFDINPDGSITLRYPWLGVAFFGENQIVTNLVDKNLSELIRSQQVQFGGSTLPPGEIPNITYNIEGGIGIFGSISTDTISTSFIRP